MKKKTIIGFILTPVLCIIAALIISIGREGANSKSQKALADYEKPSYRRLDSSIPVRDTENSQIASNKKNDILPTKEEIIATNAKLPVLVTDGTMFTRVEYDETKMVQTFYYDFTRDVDVNMITQENINQMKETMINALQETGGLERIKAGVTFLYVYRSIDKEKLYEIQITSNDLKQLQ